MQCIPVIEISTHHLPVSMLSAKLFECDVTFSNVECVTILQHTAYRPAAAKSRPAPRGPDLVSHILPITLTVNLISYLILALRMHKPHTTQTFYGNEIQFQYLFKYKHHSYN